MSSSFRHWQVETPIILQSLEENTEKYLQSIICRMRVRMHCTVKELRIVFSFTYKKDKTDVASSLHGLYTKVELQNLKERNYVGDVGLDVRIIWRQVLKKQAVRMWNRFMNVSSDGLLPTRSQPSAWIKRAVCPNHIPFYETIKKHSYPLFCLSNASQFLVCFRVYMICFSFLWIAMVTYWKYVMSITYFQ